MGLKALFLFLFSFVGSSLGLGLGLGLGSEVPPDNFDAIRQALLAKINTTRRQSHLPDLRLSGVLCAIAQRRAECIVAEKPKLDQTSVGMDSRAAAAAGYESRLFSEVAVQSDGDIDGVYAAAAEPSGALGAEIARRASRDLGVGVSPGGDTPLYVFAFGQRWPDFIAEKRSELSDLPSVRRLLLERVNRERRALKMAPLKAEPLLDDTAQRHADDMLARSYYGHYSPEGTTVLERSKASGYRPHFIAENIAQGQYSIEEVMDGWMASTVHREHIVSPMFTAVGSGVAIGRNARGYRILWVQCFGRPAVTDSVFRTRPRAAGGN